jgi:hypothetical protein
MPYGLTTFRRLTILCAAVAASACQREDLRAERLAALRNYQERLIEWRRDSTVIDSLARLVDIDSLVQLRRAAIRAGTERPYLQAMLCEQHRLNRRHGFRPTELAVERVDSAFTSSELQRFNAISASTGSGLYEVGDVVCGATGPIAPKQVSGVSLSQSRLRPMHPDSTMPPR